MSNKNELNKALLSIPVDKAREHNLWVGISTAYKAAGGDFETWDDWCKGDPEKYPNKPQYRWDHFPEGKGKKEEYKSLCRSAYKYGGYVPEPEPSELAPKDQLIKFLETLFEPDEIIKVIAQSTFDNEANKFRPVQTFKPIKVSKLMIRATKD